MAAPIPVKNAGDNVKAPGGKSKARPGLKCVSPATITQPTASATPTHNNCASFPMAVIRRYNRKTTSAQVAIATRVAGITSTLTSSEPITGKLTRMVCARKVRSSDGHRYPA